MAGRHTPYDEPVQREVNVAKSRPEQQRSRTSQERDERDRRQRALDSARGDRRIWLARVLGPQRDTSLLEAMIGTGIYVVLAVVFFSIAVAADGHSSKIWAFVLTAVWLAVGANRLRKYLAVKRTVDREVVHRLESDQR
ncbi:MAG: hypothetical protein ACR2F6_15850 [Mycobacteriales bacterium]